jgi:hypothetical protein
MPLVAANGLRYGVTLFQMIAVVKVKSKLLQYLSFFIKIDLSNVLWGFVEHFCDMIHHRFGDKFCWDRP